MKSCSVCDHEGPDVKSVDRTLTKRVDLCKFCSNTHAGNTAMYPDEYSAVQKFIAVIMAETYWLNVSEGK